jgi:anti-sigma regulatory factor (Ser/Thr protein kinase)
MIHGDYHTKNLQLTGDEVLLIDMDTLATGHPVFELAFMYNAFIGFGEYDPKSIVEFMGFDNDTAKLFWRKSLACYLETENEDQIRSVEDKARVVGYTRMIRRSIRRGGLETEEGRAEIELWKKHLLELLETVDTLVFSVNEDETGEENMNENELELEASVENLPKVLTFVDGFLERADCSMKEQMQLDVAVEEIFVNIASYAYNPGIGKATVRVEVSEDPVTVSITFIDQGVPYDPLEKDDPDVTLSAEKRQIGGLGIFMVKQSMDDVLYEYKDGSNMLTLKKQINTHA